MVPGNRVKQIRDTFLDGVKCEIDGVMNTALVPERPKERRFLIIVRHSVQTASDPSIPNMTSYAGPVSNLQSDRQERDENDWPVPVAF